MIEMIELNILEFYIRLLMVYNRENEMCIFSKRNVHFSLFFRNLSSSFKFIQDWKEKERLTVI